MKNLKRSTIVGIIIGLAVGWIVRGAVMLKIQEGDKYYNYIDIQKPKAGRYGVLNLNAVLGVDQDNSKEDKKSTIKQRIKDRAKKKSN